jgi:hypothetical protein
MNRRSLEKIVGELRLKAVAKSRKQYFFIDEVPADKHFNDEDIVFLLKISNEKL